MMMSVLVVEFYRPDPDRDDHSLYNTLVLLKTRLDISCHVDNLSSGLVDLTANEELLHQAERLRDNLGTATSPLSILFGQRNCTRKKARSAWDGVFDHTSWGEKEAAR